MDADTPAMTPRTAAGQYFYFSNAIKHTEDKLARDIIRIEEEARAEGRAEARTSDERLRERLLALDATVTVDTDGERISFRADDFRAAFAREDATSE